jgi:hypothetical protein
MLFRSSGLTGWLSGFQQNLGQELTRTDRTRLLKNRIRGQDLAINPIIAVIARRQYLLLLTNPEKSLEFALQRLFPGH